MPTEIYGTVIFLNESGEIKRVECLTEADYLRELDAGAKWIEGEPKSRNVGVYGIRRGFPSDVPAKSSDLPELHAAAKVLQEYHYQRGDVVTHFSKAGGVDIYLVSDDRVKAAFERAIREFHESASS